LITEGVENLVIEDMEAEKLKPMIVVVGFVLIIGAFLKFSVFAYSACRSKLGFKLIVHYKAGL
jgi:hypothetical protein